MSTISKQTFGVGPTIRVRMEYEENQTNFDKNEPIPFGHKVNIQMIKVTGIDAIEYNNSGRDWQSELARTGKRDRYWSDPNRTSETTENHR